ncbi:MAG: hypothetical protein HN368_06505 [Spirochaetales bacterium]|nr:hypothetical protein [Spirochaetales bacterium]
MQTGIFYVKLKENIDPAEQGENLAGRIEYLRKAFSEKKPYPVLAVEFREVNKTKQTFYHMPTEDNELKWFSSDYFLFARD